MKFGDLRKMSKSPRKEPPMKDLELALREVLDEYQALPKAKILSALETMMDVVEADEDDLGPKEPDDGDETTVS